MMADEDQPAIRHWVLIRDPGCIPEKKGPFPRERLAGFLREVFAARPVSHVAVVSLVHGDLITEDGPTALMMLDGRSVPTARAHIARLKADRALTAFQKVGGE